MTTRRPCTTGSRRSVPRRSSARSRTSRQDAPGSTPQPRPARPTRERSARKKPNSTGRSPASNSSARCGRCVLRPARDRSCAAKSIKIWRARCVARTGTPGEVLELGAEGVLIACGEGALQANGVAARRRNTPRGRGFPARFSDHARRTLWRRSLRRWRRRRHWSRGLRPAAACRRNWNAPTGIRARAPHRRTSATARCGATAARRRSSLHFRAAPARRIRLVEALLWCSLYALESGRYAEYTVVDQAARACVAMQRGGAKGYVNALLRNFLRARAGLETRLGADEVAHYLPSEVVDRSRPRGLSVGLGTGAGCRQYAPADVPAREPAPHFARRPMPRALRRRESPRRRIGPQALLLEKPVPVERLPGFAAGRGVGAGRGRAARGGIAGTAGRAARTRCLRRTGGKKRPYSRVGGVSR